MTPVYKLSANSVKNGRTVYGSMLAGNAAFIPTSFDSIATITVGAGGSAFAEFTSIPSTYAHLQIRAIMQSTRSAQQDTANLQFNGDTGTNYSYHSVWGRGGSSTIFSAGAATQSYIEWYEISAASNANIFSVSIIDILDYANTNKFKTVQIMHQLDFNVSNSSSKIGIFQGNWRSNNAITSIKIYPATGPNFAQNTKFALYGIKAV